MKKVLKLAKTYTEANRSFAPLAIQDKHKKNKMKKNLMLKKPSHNQFPSHNQLTGHNQFPPPNPPTQPPQLKKPQPTGYSNESIPIHKYSATRPPGLFFFHPLHTKIKEILQYSLPFFPQYTYYQTTNNDQRTYVDEFSLVPTLSWTSYYHFTNPLALTLYNNPDDNEICQSRLHHLTRALHEKQFTIIGLTQPLNRFVAQKANRISINHYDHAIARYMEEKVLEEDENTIPQITEKFFIKS